MKNYLVKIGDRSIKVRANGKEEALKKAKKIGDSGVLDGVRKWLQGQKSKVLKLVDELFKIYEGEIRGNGGIPNTKGLERKIYEEVSIKYDVVERTTEAINNSFR